MYVVHGVLTGNTVNVCGAWGIDREHCSPIDWLFLAYKAVIHDGRFMRGWNGAFIQQNCPFACWQAMYCWSMIAAAFHSLYVTPVCLLLILYWANRLLCRTGRLKTSYSWSCCALFCICTLMRSRNCPFAVDTCVLRYWWNEGCHLMIYAGAWLRVVQILCV